jgi:hypothetical protein
MKPLLVIWENLPANGMAIYPFILLKSESMRNDRTLINHEKIHLQQQLELLIIPFYILYILNYLFNIIRYKNHHQAYLNIIFEREAYRFDHNLDYLDKRKFLAWSALL